MSFDDYEKHMNAYFMLDLDEYEVEANYLTHMMNSNI